MITAIQSKTRDLLVRYDAWFLVLVAVLLVLAFILTTAMAIWCLNNGHGSFTGAWSYSDLLTANFQCTW